MTSEKRESGQNRKSRARRALRYVLIITLVSAGLFVVLEGVCSVAAFGYRLITFQPIAERSYTEYDELLGWINKPQQDLPDMYGTGIGLRTNRQRFRNEQDVDKSVTGDTRRIICSGDSFTFGYGVSNSQAWCQLLSTLR